MRIGRRSDFIADCKRILLSFSLVRLCVINSPDYMVLMMIRTRVCTKMGSSESSQSPSSSCTRGTVFMCLNEFFSCCMILNVNWALGAIVLFHES